MNTVPRVEHPGCWYHVMNRGASGRVAAVPDPDAFVRLLAQARSRWPVEIHAYCLMGSHYHLLLRGNPDDVAASTRQLDEGFGQRCRAIAVTAGRHLVYVNRYIHLNPVEAALAIRPEAWPFSSYRGYLDPDCAPHWLTTARILGWFGALGGRRRYRAFVEQGLDLGVRDVFGRRRLPAAGDDADGFLEELRRRAALELPARGSETTGLERVGLSPPLPLAAIGRAVAQVFEVAPESLHTDAPAARPQALARGALIHAARRAGGYRLREIAAWLRYASLAGAARAALRFAAEARRDRDLELRLEEVLRRCSLERISSFAGV